MKLHRIHLRNINSLAGEMTIDFTHPEYTTNGLFAIVGPTGAGKSSILDAICLALYGRTPRQKNISQTQNEVITRDESDCFAEVEFQTARGFFRARWSQRRAHGKNEGALQDYEHRLDDADSGTPLTEKKSEVKSKVEEVTGLTFEQFTRAVLLAQGEFAKFLQSAENDRAAILEQITGTAIYAEISKATFARQKEEANKLAVHEKVLAQLTLLADEEVQQFSEEKENLQVEVNSLAAQLEALQKTQRLQEEFDKLSREASQLERDNREYQQQISEFSTQRTKLESAQNAAKIEPHAEQVSRTTKQYHEIKNELMACTAQITPHKNRHETCVKEFNQATSSNNSARAAVEFCQQLMEEIAPLDNEILLMKEQSRCISAEVRERDAEISKLNQEYISPELVAEEEVELKDKLKSSQRRYDLLSQQSGLSPSLLIAGKECPLCGSLEHPNPISEESGVKNKEFLLELQSRINQFEQDLDALRKRHRNAELAQEQQGMLIREWERLEAKRAELSFEIHTRTVKRGTLINDANLEDKDVARELQRRKKTLAETDERLNQVRAQHTASENRLVKLQTESESFTKQLTDSNAEMSEAIKVWNKVLAESGFENRDVWQAARMDSKQRKLLEDSHHELESCGTKLSTLFDENEKSIKAHPFFDQTETARLSVAELETQIKANSEKLAESQQRVGVLHERLTEQTRRASEKKLLLQQKEEQQKNCRIWKELDRLIGASEGAKYRKFVQRITFETLVARSNDKLKTMTDRYLLRAHQENSLELSVVDLWQGAQERSTKNLSGGESFLVSLALALGLSSMAGEKVQIDSLFLDEGFGTLDEATLSRALDALGKVRGEGKLIGIISHVPQIKDCMTTRIKVIPQRNGRSKLSGPGIKVL